MSIDPREGDEFCLVHPDKLKNPFPDYPYFRQQRPVFYYPPMNAWFIFRYADVDRLFHEPRLSNRRMGGYVAGALAEFRPAIERLFHDYFRHWVLSLDGDEHRQLRKILQPHFSEHAVALWEPAIEGLTHELLDKLQARGRMDFSQEFSYTLPVLVISSLLGIPPEQRQRVLAWSDHLACYFNIIPPTVITSRNLVEGTQEMAAYLKGLLAERRARPESDLLSQLAQSDLAEEVIAANAMVLLVAGHETTRNLLGSAIALLLEHPTEMAKVREDRSLIPGLIEETLRCEPANPMMARAVAEDFDYLGHPFRTGQLVFLCIGSANRDPEFVDDPERFDISRKPKKHLAFGSGPHYCLGSLLAKKEASIALPTVLQRLSNLRADPSLPARWLTQAGMRGPLTLPIMWD